MDNRAEVREFLTTRRAKISPEQAGLPSSGQRRVPGLRRSEVAALAGMSVEYYAKLERGALAGVSPGVLEAIARTLRLDDAERAHLMRLAHEADGSNAVLRPARRLPVHHGRGRRRDDADGAAPGALTPGVYRQGIPPGHRAPYRRRRGQPSRGARLPHHPPRQYHA